MTYKVLLEKMTPVYSLVTVMATTEEGAVESALAEAAEFNHERLPGDGVWSTIPPVDILIPADDGEPRAVGVCEANVDAANLSCFGSNLITTDGIIGPHFVYLDLSDAEASKPSEPV
jgi:hypothetical protein